MKTSSLSKTMKIISWNGDRLEGAAALGSRLRELSSVCRPPPALARGGGVHLVRAMPNLYPAATERSADMPLVIALQGCISSILIYCDNAGKAKSAQLSDSLVIKLVSEITRTAWAPD